MRLEKKDKNVKKRNKKTSTRISNTLNITDSKVIIIVVIVIKNVKCLFYCY